MSTFHEPAMCPPCVCLVSAVAAPRVACVRQVSPLCLLWPCLQTLSVMCPPYVFFGFPSKSRPPCVSQALCLWVGFGRASKRVSHVALCVRSLSFLCSFAARSLCALYPLFDVFWPGLWFGFGRAFVNSVSVLWFLRLCLFCVRCCPPKSRSLWLRLCPLFVWSHL